MSRSIPGDRFENDQQSPERTEDSRAKNHPSDERQTWR